LYYPTAVIDFTAPLALLTQAVTDLQGFVVSGLTAIGPSVIIMSATAGVFYLGYRLVRRATSGA